MTSARSDILNKLRAARRPFPDAPPRPAAYLDVTLVEDDAPAALAARFTAELERLGGHAHTVSGDDAAVAKVVELIRAANTDHILAWDFQYIPLPGLPEALAAASIRTTFPDLHIAERAAHADAIKWAGAGVIGVDAAAAGTGTLIVSTAPGKGRVPTVLPPVLIAVIRREQLVPRLETWLANERARSLETMWNADNLCFITGPSRTGDIEMTLVLGVHGPGTVHAVIVA